MEKEGEGACFIAYSSLGGGGWTAGIILITVANDRPTVTDVIFNG